jgi:tetratricopeptide (TPR) repeat protein
MGLMAKPLQKKRKLGNPDMVEAPVSSPGFSSRVLLATWQSWLPQVLLIAGLTVWIYWPSLRGEFIWDDNWYLTNNPLMRGVSGLWKFWAQPGSWVEYYPVQETVQWAQWELWGTETLGYHLTNVALHIISALLVWRLLAKFGLRLAWVGGVIFAVHPVQVESVAWISELKNTLSLPFFLLAMCSWIDFEESRRQEDYQNALGLFLLALLCKITMAPFAVVILLYAWWKRGRVDLLDLKASGPFFIIAIGLGIVSMVVGHLYLERGHAPPDKIDMGSLFERIGGAGVITMVYLARVFLPVGIMLGHPQWQVSFVAWIGYVGWLALLGMGWWIWTKRATWGRHMALGLGFFLITLAPFLGFETVSYMKFTWVLDHLLYIPMIGIIGLVVAGLGSLEGKLPTGGRFVVMGMVGVLVIGMAAESRTFAGLFLNEQTLWSYTLQRNPDFWMGHDNLGEALLVQKKYAEAIPEFEAVIRLKPDFDEGYYNLGVALDESGKTAEAEAKYREAIALNPSNARAYLTLADLEKTKGNIAEAEDLLRHAVAVNPNYSAAQIDLGDILVETGRAEEAASLYEQAIEANPDFAQLYYNLGNALLKSGHVPEAIVQFQAAVDLDATVAPMHENLGVALARSWRMPEAISEFQAALAIDPGYQAARDNLGLALMQTGRLDEAKEQFQQALKANPTDVKAAQSLVKLQEIQMKQHGIPGH